MAGTKEIKRRIKSVKSTKKITKAMELVSASKMKRAVSKTLASRLYANYSWDLLTSLSDKLEGEELTHPFFVENKNSKDRSLIVLITSNRGLCGGYNSQIIKKTIGMLKNELAPKQGLGAGVDIVTIGKKGDSAMRRIRQNVVATFTDFSDNLTLQEISPLATFLTNEYKNRNYKNIYIGYTDFISALSQKANIKKLLPISKTELKDVIDSLGDKKEETPKQKAPYLFEGDINILLQILAEKLVKMQVYQMLLESSASEQSSRMVAMKNANEAAGEMIDDLTLVFNKARQAGITREISEISAGMASVS
jgi:F-type H+-transporting ATPase subunit gamma